MALVINLEISILGDLLNLFINKYLWSTYYVWTSPCWAMLLKYREAGHGQLDISITEALSKSLLCGHREMLHGGGV